MSPLSSTTAPTHQPMFPIGAGANLSAFQSVSEAGVGGVPPGGSTVPPLLQMQTLPNQTQPYPGMPLLPPKDEKTDDKVQGLNWMQNPGLVGSSFNMMPYLMGHQSQLGMGGLGIPVSQQAMNLLNSNLATGNQMSSEGVLGKVGGPGTQKESMIRKTQQRRGSSAPLDVTRDSVHHRAGEISPSNTPPLAGAGSKISQYPLVSETSKWKGMGPGASEQTAQSIMAPPYGTIQNPSASSHLSTTTLPNHVMTNPSHVMPIGFSPTPPGSNSPGPYLPKGRGEGLGGSPRGDKMKLRIHQVRNDDFKLQVKPDRRRKKWRGKDKDILLSTARAELGDSVVRRMVGIIGNDSAAAPSKDISPPIRALPASLGVEPGTSKQVSEKSDLPTSSSSNDGNYALNMLADMSSIQSKEGSDQDQLAVKPRTTEAFLRSPVSLAARSLLMLGEDLNTQGQGDAPVTKPSDVTHFESSAATSLLQLSGAVIPKSSGKEGPPVMQRTGSGARQEGGHQQQPFDNQVQSTRSASFSAAEAMIMMGTGSEDMSATAAEDVKDSSHRSKFLERFSPPVATAAAATEKDPTTSATHKSPRKTDMRLSLDSEATDTDSESTLTPESPRFRQRLPALIPDKERSNGPETTPLNSGRSGRRGVFHKEGNGNGFVKELSSTDHVELGFNPVVSDPLSSAARVNDTEDPVHVESFKQPVDSEPPKHSPPADTPDNSTMNRKPCVSEDMTPLAVDSGEVHVTETLLDRGEQTAMEVSSQSPHRADSSSTPPPAKRPKFISTFGPAASDADDAHSLTPLCGKEEGGEDIGMTEGSGDCSTAGAVAPSLPEHEESPLDLRPVNIVSHTELPLEELPGVQCESTDVERSIPENPTTEPCTDAIMSHTESPKMLGSEARTMSPNSPVDNDAAGKEDAPKKVIKIVKRRKDGSLSKTSHSKTRLIKIKRAKSPKASPPSSSAGDAEISCPSSWADFADTAIRDAEHSTEGGAGERLDLKVTATQPEEIRSEGPWNPPTTESLPMESPPMEISSQRDSIPSVDDAPPPDAHVAPQNRLKINRAGGTHKHHHHHHKSTTSPQVGKAGKDLKPENKLFSTKSPSKPAPKSQQEAKGRDLFQVDAPVPKKENKKEQGVKPKKHKPSSTKPPAGAGDGLRGTEKSKPPQSKPPQSKLPQGKRCSDSDDSIQYYSQTTDHHPPQSSSREPKPRPHLSPASVEHRDLPHESKSRSHPPASTVEHRDPPPAIERERDFSPLSDDNLARVNSPSRRQSAKSAKWTDDGEWKFKGHRHHPGTVEEPSLPSPSSSMGSSGSKKHRHRHSAAAVVSDGHSSKQEHRSDKSSSRGPTPERKRHSHHQHHRRHHHHSHEGRTPHDATPTHHATASKSEVQRRPYESISEDDMFDGARPRGSEWEGLDRRGLHDGALKSTSNRKRRRISSDGSMADEHMAAVSADSSRHSIALPSKHKKAKHSKEHKQRWKEESKHRHPHKQH